MNIRQAAVSGSFYPEEEQQLLAAIAQLMTNCTEIERLPKRPKGLIVPHAGYLYSGSVAASAYHQLIPYTEDIKQVVVLGPSHRVPLRGIALPDSSYFQTPMGLIELDTEKIHELARLSNVTVHPQAHHNEHCLEVQLPFLQYLLDDFTLIPLIVGMTPPAELYPLLDSLWNGPETLFIVSTDLSHYHSYQQAKTLDHATSRAILQLNSNITGEQACGCQALNGMLLTLQKKGLDITELDVRNSGDTAGSKEQVVGYGAYAFY